LNGLDVRFECADLVSEPASLQVALAGCEQVFHAAMPFSYEPRRRNELMAIALQGSENLLQAAAAAGVRRVVLTSSSVVFGHSLKPRLLDETGPLAAAHGEGGYVAAKIAQDKAAFALGAQLGLEVVAVCPTVSVGPHDSALGPSNGVIVGYLADPFRFTYPGGCNIVSVADVAAGHCLAAEHGRTGERYILGSENLTWSAVHALVSELAGIAPPGPALNHTSSYLAATAEELHARLQGRSARTNRERAEMVGRYYWYRHDRAASELGYQPHPARRALAEALSWLAMSRHIGRELRTSLRLHDEVYAARGASVDAPILRIGSR